MIKNNESKSNQLINKLKSNLDEKNHKEVMKSLEFSFSELKLFVRFDRDEAHFNPLYPNSTSITHNEKNSQVIFDYVKHFKESSNDLYYFIFNLLKDKDKLISEIRKVEFYNEALCYQLVIPVFWDRNKFIPTFISSFDEKDTDTMVSNIKIADIDFSSYILNEDDSWEKDKVRLKNEIREFIKKQLLFYMEESISELTISAVSNNFNKEDYNHVFLQFSTDNSVFENSRRAISSSKLLMNGLSREERLMVIDWLKTKYKLN
jgi:hypothetical protein